jgi:hypothetical protein
MTQIESTRPSKARAAAREHVSREVLPKQIEAERAKPEKAADHAATKYVKAKKTEKTVNRHDGPVLKPEKSRSGRKSAAEKSAASAKTPDAAAAQVQRTSEAAKSDVFDKFKDVVGKLTEGAKLVTGLINEFKGVGLALKDFVCALKGECKPAAAPEPGAPSGGAAQAAAPGSQPAQAAPAKPSGAPAPAVDAPAAEAPADPAEALRQLRQTFETILAQFELLLRQLHDLLDPAKLGKKDQAKAWSGVSNGLGYPLTARGEIADPEAFKLWAAALPPAPSSGAPQAGQPAPQAPAPGSVPQAPAPAPAGSPDAVLKPDNPYRITHDGNSTVYVNTIQEPNIAPKASWRNDLMGAINRVQEKGLGLDPNDRNKILDYDTYHQAVVLEMRALGYKAFHDGEEIQVTRPGADHSEHYDISTSAMLVRRFYASWISPPAFE